MIFFTIFRFIMQMACWIFMMGYSAYQVIFQNEYWAIMVFFIFLALIVITIKEFSDDRRKA